MHQLKQFIYNEEFFFFSVPSIIELDYTVDLRKFYHCYSVVSLSASLQPHGLQHARLLCPSLSPGVAQIQVHWVGDTSNHFILCCPFIFLPLIFPSIRAFSNELALCIRWSKYWSFSKVLPMNILGWFPLGLTGLISLLSNGLSRVFSYTTVQKHHFFSVQPSLWSTSHIRTWLLEKSYLCQ